MGIFLAWVNASSWNGVHTKLLRALSMGRSEASTAASSFIIEASWLTKPKNDIRSVQLLGVGNFNMASVISLPTV